MPRNFTCPQTNEPCDEGGCKKGVLCVLEERERANARASQEAARGNAGGALDGLILQHRAGRSR